MNSEANVRKPGYYWVKVWDEWGIVQLDDDGKWWVFGSEYSTRSPYYQEIDETPITRNEPVMEKKIKCSNCNDEGYQIGADGTPEDCPYCDIMKQVHTMEKETNDKIYLDGDFNEGYESRVKKATGKNMIISKDEFERLARNEATTRELLEALKELGGNNEEWDLALHYRVDGIPTSLKEKIQSLITKAEQVKPPEK